VNKFFDHVLLGFAEGNSGQLADVVALPRISCLSSREAINDFHLIRRPSGFSATLRQRGNRGCQSSNLAGVNDVVHELGGKPQDF
jgi:hypothetical protein